MSDIKYVVVSDMHLGAENSILTNLKGNTTLTDTAHAGDALIKLVECIKEVLKTNTGPQKPTLVLNGDLIELALSTTNNSVMAFERFIELIMPVDDDFLFADEILFLPGNHDHNLWELSRNNYFIQNLLNIRTDAEIADEINSTSLFNPAEIPAILLSNVIKRYPHMEHVKVSMNYPARAFVNDSNRKCVIFCHGHYVESMYALMTSLRSSIFPDRQKPQFLDELEKENYAWIDFFWSTLGRSGSVGRDINLIYDKIQDPVQVDDMIDNIVGTFTASETNKLKKWVEAKALKEILEVTVGRLATSERDEPDVELSDDATQGLKTLMELYIMNELKAELHSGLPDHFTFIFGHTHKPFERLVNYDGYSNPVKIYNSGGWVVDTKLPQQLHGGSVIFVDEEHEAVSLHCYKEGNPEISVAQVLAEGEKNSDLFNKMQALINMGAEPWAGLAAAAMAEVSLRHKNLLEIMESSN